MVLRCCLRNIELENWNSCYTKTTTLRDMRLVVLGSWHCPIVLPAILRGIILPGFFLKREKYIICNLLSNKLDFKVVRERVKALEKLKSEGEKVSIKNHS